MNPSRIAENRGLWGGRLLLFDELDSTNQWALEHLGDCMHGDTVRAVRQTAGYGRFRRPWLAPGGLCLTQSTVIQPNTPEHSLNTVIQPVAALAVHSALTRLGMSPTVKWPNDVLLNNAKLCGILSEVEPGTSSVILGIGLNVNTQPDDLESDDLLYPATSILSETGKMLEIEAVQEAVLEQLDLHVKRTLADPDKTATIWNTFDTMVGRRITITHAQGRQSGIHGGMNPDGSLRLVSDDGSIFELWSGDISLHDR